MHTFDIISSGSTSSSSAAVAAVLVSELFDINELVEETVELFLSKTLFLLEPNG